MTHGTRQMTHLTRHQVECTAQEHTPLTSSPPPSTYPPIFNLSSLRHLHIDSPCLTSLPSSLFLLPSLQHLHVSGHHWLSELPSDCFSGPLSSSLTHLHLDQCRVLTSLPHSLPLLSALRSPLSGVGAV
ncbi:hypothetical protein CLOM_g3860 [Closterium sp. NIES-68]|nr:hypothetical protein CLOM_g3860 [Closterium sp. NIES-68]GJP68176.1 hypothetical protein CLOP_g24912 [Closterium sp. NIES-67]